MKKKSLFKTNLKGHVQQLAGAIGERNMQNHQALTQAAQYISHQFESFGYDVNRQTYSIKEKSASNIIAEIKGTNDPEEIVIIGAHYDSVLTSPGANDNASGVAALLELARLMKSSKPKRTIRFIAFVNEEPPYFLSHQMGSYQYAQQAYERDENITAMASLETIGYFSDEPNSQKYPAPFKFFYPDKGHFIAFIGRVGDKKSVKNSIEIFRKQAAFPSEGVAAPNWIPGVSWSDHWSFWKYGYSAMMITDTAPYRYPYYHSAKDTPEKLDYSKMARITSGLQQVFFELANHKD